MQLFQVFPSPPSRGSRWAVTLLNMPVPRDNCLPVPNTCHQAKQTAVKHVGSPSAQTYSPYFVCLLRYKWNAVRVLLLSYFLFVFVNCQQLSSEKAAAAAAAAAAFPAPVVRGFREGLNPSPDWDKQWQLWKAEGRVGLMQISTLCVCVCARARALEENPALKHWQPPTSTRAAQQPTVKNKTKNSFTIFCVFGGGRRGLSLQFPRSSFFFFFFLTALGSFMEASSIQQQQVSEGRGDLIWRQDGAASLKCAECTCWSATRGGRKGKDVRAPPSSLN